VSLLALLAAAFAGAALAAPLRTQTIVLAMGPDESGAMSIGASTFGDVIALDPSKLRLLARPFAPGTSGGSQLGIVASIGAAQESVPSGPRGYFLTHPLPYSVQHFSIPVELSGPPGPPGIVAPASLAVEVVEGSLIRSGDRAERMLRRLRSMGVKIWIDDFGVEYSSLRYLHRLPIDGLKIDRAFVGGADGNLASPAIVRLIIELARSLELGVVAEGIETERQREALIALGCLHGQGYLFSLAGRTVSERSIAS
jgi:EAL domain